MGLGFRVRQESCKGVRDVCVCVHARAKGHKQMRQQVTEAKPNALPWVTFTFSG